MADRAFSRASFPVHLDRFLPLLRLQGEPREPLDRRPLIVRTHDRFTSERARGPPIDTDRATTRPRASLGGRGGKKKKEKKTNGSDCPETGQRLNDREPNRPVTGPV